MVKIEVEKFNPDYLGVAWENKTKDGSMFLSVKINKDIADMPKEFLMFKNTKKREGKKDPDWNMVRAKKK